jgi:hypothetical protein
MICPKCHKRILFDLNEQPLPLFDFSSDKWFHASCWHKMQLKKRTVIEEKHVAERQKLIAEWSSF